VCRRREVVTNEKTAINENGKSSDVDGEQGEREMNCCTMQKTHIASSPQA
jgi:hypothetical protein